MESKVKFCGIEEPYLHARQRSRQFDVEETADELVRPGDAAQLGLMEVPKDCDHGVVLIAEERPERSLCI